MSHIMKIVKTPTGAYDVRCNSCSYHFVAKSTPRFHTITLDAGEDVDHVSGLIGENGELLSIDLTAKKGQGPSLADQLFKGVK